METKITPAFRVFVSAPIDDHLTPVQQTIKHGVYDLLHQNGFDLQKFVELGLPIQEYMRWSIDNADEVMSYCQGAVVIGLARWRFPTDAGDFLFPTEYSHCEGTLALARKLPTLLILENGTVRRGLFHTSHHRIFMPPNADTTWLTDPNSNFTRDFGNWTRQVNARYHIFLGYSSKSRPTAEKIIKSLTAKGVRVLDWDTGFTPAGTILEQIQDAESRCLGGIFLFMKDDELISGDIRHATPRDNVIFETGYFMSKKGDKRVLIVLEEGAKMPADVGGQIHLTLRDRNDISPIEEGLFQFVTNRL